MAEEEAKALQSVLDEIVMRMAMISDRGTVASYIPELATVDLDRFGIALALTDGTCLTAGDANTPFSIQSISKVFSLALALELAGATLWSRVGREPSGDPFNSIVLLENDKGVPRNPFINPGAIVVADVILSGRTPKMAVRDILQLCRRLSGDDTVRIDSAVAASETQTGDRNRALAYFMAAEGNIKASVDEVLEVYFNQCAISMSCAQLAAAGRCLCAAGRKTGPEDGTVTADRARRINALMMSCGLYDASGEFGYRIGIPAKSGVGGGIIGIVPGIASVAVWSPGLDANGNSKLGVLALEELVRATGWSVFGPLTPDGAF
ncbi:MAG: glutaminase [Pseudomonadota bacterium]